MQSFLDAIRTIFGVFLDALTFIRLCFKPGLASRPRTCFCANSSAYISSAKSNHDELPMPFALPLLSVRSVRLAERSHHRQTRHVDSLAPHRLPFVLEVQVSASRTTSRSSPAAEADRRDGNEQPNLGRGAHCRRTIAQDWHPDFATYCSALHAEDTTASCRPEATVDDLRAQSGKS